MRRSLPLFALVLVTACALSPAEMGVFPCADGGVCTDDRRCIAGQCHRRCVSLRIPDEDEKNLPAKCPEPTGCSNSNASGQVCLFSCTAQAQCPEGVPCLRSGKCDAPRDLCTDLAQCATTQGCCGTSLEKHCLDLMSDPAHCGACGTACTAGKACVAGACK